jgi:hypothetical protein
MYAKQSDRRINMGWEEVPAGPSGGFATKMADDEIAIVMSKVRNTPVYRLNMARALFPEEAIAVVIRLDKEKKRIGVFPANGKSDRKLSSYSKGSRLVYVCLPKSIGDIGFTKGRYKFKKLEKFPDMYFMVRPDDKVGDFPTEEELIKKQKEALAGK